jgi:hypothetical protein
MYSTSSYTRFVHFLSRQHHFCPRPVRLIGRDGGVCGTLEAGAVVVDAFPQSVCNYNRHFLPEFVAVAHRSNIHIRNHAPKIPTMDPMVQAIISGM